MIYQLWHFKIFVIKILSCDQGWMQLLNFILLLLYTYFNYKSIQAKLNQNHQFSLTLIPEMCGFLMVGYS